jgi:hypothetical protein
MIAAVEDALSEAVVRKIIAEVRPDLTLYQVMRKNGSGYIRSILKELNQAARTLPVFVVIDLDRPEPCPADLIRQFLPHPRAANLVFRVAVMEIESWVIADGEAFARFLAIPRHAVPDDPDSIAEPKELIATLARRSRRRELREDLAPKAGDVRRVGAGFNPRMIAFVENEWSLVAASAASRSLRKAVERLQAAF